MLKVGGGGIVDGGDRRECNRRHEKYHIRRYERYHITYTSEGTHQLAGLSELIEMDVSRLNADGGDELSNEHAVVVEMDVEEGVESALALEGVEGRAVVTPGLVASRCVSLRRLGCVDVVTY